MLLKGKDKKRDKDNGTNTVQKAPENYERLIDDIFSAIVEEPNDETSKTVESNSECLSEHTEDITSESTFEQNPKIFENKTEEDENVPEEKLEKIETPLENVEDVENFEITDSITADASGDEPAEADSNENSDAPLEEIAEENPVSVPEQINSEKIQIVEIPHEDSIHKWKNDTITSISEEYSEEKINSNEIDDELLVALGYVSKEEENEKDEHDSLLPEKLFGLKKEFSDMRESAIVREEFKREKGMIEFRLIASCALAFLLFLYPFAANLLSETIELFDISRFFKTNMLICLQILLIIAAFSAKDLFSGFIKIFTLKPDAYSPSAMLLVFVSAATVVYAFLANPSGSRDVSMYMLFTAIMLILPIITDLWEINQQRFAFRAATGGEDGHAKSTRLDEAGGEFCMTRKGIITDFSARVSENYENPKLMNLMIIPSVVLSAVAGMFTYFMTKDAESAIYSASLCASIIFPSTFLFGTYPFYSGAHGVLSRMECAIVGRSSLKALSELEWVSIKESEIFKSDSATPINMELYNDTSIFDMMYCAASALHGRKTALAEIFRKSAEDLELSKDIQIIEDTENGIGALIDNKFAVVIGNAIFISEHDLEVPYAETSDTNDGMSTPLYIAINGKVAAYLCIDYAVSKEFYRIADAARANGIKLKIHSNDFCINNELIAAKLHMNEDEFELTRDPWPDDGREHSAGIVTSGDPSGLFNARKVAQLVISTEHTVKKLSGILSVVSIICAILITALGYTVSQYPVILFHCLLTAPVIILSRTYFSGHGH